jgi:hypothetical protein
VTRGAGAERLEKAKNNAWRDVADIDGAHARGEIDGAQWGFAVAGRVQREHRTEPRIAYRCVWIDAE